MSTKKVVFDKDDCEVITPMVLTQEGKWRQPRFGQRVYPNKNPGDSGSSIGPGDPSWETKIIHIPTGLEASEYRHSTPRNLELCWLRIKELVNEWIEASGINKVDE